MDDWQEFNTNFIQSTLGKHFTQLQFMNNSKIAFSEDGIPSEFICPITQEVMREPLMSRTGHNFERNAILKWIAKHNTCPLTRQPLPVSDLITNRPLKAKIQSWCKTRGIDQDKDADDSSDRRILLTCGASDMPQGPKLFCSFPGSERRQRSRGSRRNTRAAMSA